MCICICACVCMCVYVCTYLYSHGLNIALVRSCTLKLRACHLFNKTSLQMVGIKVEVEIEDKVEELGLEIIQVISRMFLGTLLVC